MPITDPRVDAYIAKSADFAQPILVELRARMHKGCPDCEEAIKWGMPSFLYHGKILGNMAAFKQHATFGFWRRDAAGQANSKEQDAMGQLGRLTTIKELPAKAAFSKMVKEAMALIDAGAPSAAPKHAKPELTTPAAFTAALKKNKPALATFDSFPPSARREYVEWIVEAKTEATRDKRMAQAIEWLAEGKRRHWKYQNC